MLEWVSQSPDLNPMEHLWDEVDRRIPPFARTNVNKFRAALHREWDLIPIEKNQKAGREYAWAARSRHQCQRWPYSLLN